MKIQDHNNDLYQMHSNIYKIDNVDEFINALWDNSLKNAVSIGYMAGIVDGLYWSGKITQAKYTELCKKFGL